MALNYDIGRIRNIGIIAHIDAGKTTVSERILYYSGKEHRLGEVHEGTATMDYLQEEQERGITITSAATTLPWRDMVINLIDTPGHVDFTAEVERSLRVLDSAIGVFCAVAGVEAQSETVWRQANSYRVPTMAFVNKMDRVGADFFRTIESMRRRLPGCHPVPIMLPMGSEKDFQGVIDLVKMQAIKYEEETHGQRFVLNEIPEPHRELAAEWHAKLLEAVAETSDALTEKFINGEEITFRDLVSGIREATIARKITPVFCGSALKNKGVQRLLDGVCAFLPSPEEVVQPVGKYLKDDSEFTARPDDKGPLLALAFKTIVDQHGDLTFVRVYEGTMKSGGQVFNSRYGKMERVNQIYQMHANRREAVETAKAGQIVAVVGLKEAVTGDTLCVPERKAYLEPPHFPQTVISMRVEPKSVADRDKLSFVLRRLAKEDPTFRFQMEEETGQLVILGMGELHLEVLKNRMVRDFGVDADVGQPRVAYRQTLAKSVEVRHRFAKQTGGKGMFAEVDIAAGPAPKTGVEIVSKVTHGAIPREFIRAAEAGIRDAILGGGDTGFETTDVQVTIRDGKTHEVDSSEQAFSICGYQAFQEAMAMAGVVILEPIMNLEVVTPTAYLSGIIGDLNSRRAQILSLETTEEPNLVHVAVPLSEVFGYATVVRSLSQGRAAYSMEPREYAPVPPDVQARLVF